MNPMVDDPFAQLLSHLRQYWDYLWHMSDVARLVFNRNGVPVYRYPTDQGTEPVSVLRMHADLPDQRGRHIHDFPALAYDPATGLVAVAAAGATLEPHAVSDSRGSIGVFFDPAALGDAGCRHRPGEPIRYCSRSCTATPAVCCACRYLPHAGNSGRRRSPPSTPSWRAASRVIGRRRWRT